MKVSWGVYLSRVSDVTLTMNRRKFFGAIGAAVAAALVPAAPRNEFTRLGYQFDPYDSTYTWWKGGKKCAVATARAVENMGGLREMETRVMAAMQELAAKGVTPEWARMREKTPCYFMGRMND